MSDARTRDAELYRSIAARLAGSQQGAFSITEAAQMTGTTPAILRAWSSRYGWPSPRRTSTGYRRFTTAEIEQIKQVRAQMAAGRELREILADGQVHLPCAQPQPTPAHLEFGELSAPRTGDGYDVRTRLIAGLLQRHPGIVRWALAMRDRLPPHDREASVNGILRLAAEQLGHPGWLLEVMHAL
jgi:transposase-like protein